MSNGSSDCCPECTASRLHSELMDTKGAASKLRAELADRIAELETELDRWKSTAADNDASYCIMRDAVETERGHVSTLKAQVERLTALMNEVEANCGCADETDIPCANCLRIEALKEKP